MNRNPGFIVDVGWNFANLSDDIHSSNHLTKNNMLPVKMGTLVQSHEKLTTVCVGTPVSHGENTALTMSSHEVLIIEIGLALG